MPTTAIVSGLFRISMDVEDGAGHSIPQISTSTAGARHVVALQNISTIPLSARIVTRLPNGPVRIEFSGAATLDRWDKQITHIAANGQATLECDLRRNSGAPRPNEPIQCDEMYQRQGSLPWVQLYSGLPFQTTVDAV